MGEDDWDKSGVVKSCNINRPNNDVAPNLGMETSPNDVSNYFDIRLASEMTNFNGLSTVFSIDFPIAHQEKPNDQVKIMNQNGNQELYLHPIQPAQFIQQSSFLPSPTTIVCMPPITTTPQELIDQQKHLDIRSNIYPNVTFPMRNPSIQTTTRKSQSKMITYELLQEELTNDIWRWHKCGQKHIKGSPFLRNYYKCSTSKFCEAKKIIEKSPKGENLFLVSYSGEHNHNLPMNRRNLVGCNTSSKFKLPKGINIVPKASMLNASSSSSKCAKRSRAVASPIIPTMPTLEIRSKNKMADAAEKNRGDGKEEVNMNEDNMMDLKNSKELLLPPNMEENE
ncbi:probable WRKY transcription factor 27 [Solanum stenotomum]|uniref:probable WRKY transcription factor 27 n=1 Tax=Solanum stenotomum TaxID=172797 RepID=UPI0020D19B02|nr:probable WRKY transcription factor 27 [Solanum stenotomum]